MGRKQYPGVPPLAAIPRSGNTVPVRVPDIAQIRVRQFAAHIDLVGMIRLKGHRKQVDVTGFVLYNP